MINNDEEYDAALDELNKCFEQELEIDDTLISDIAAYERKRFPRMYD